MVNTSKRRIQVQVNNAQIELIKATRSLPVKEIKTVDEYNNWVENGND